MAPTTAVVASPTTRARIPFSTKKVDHHNEVVSSVVISRPMTTPTSPRLTMYRGILFKTCSFDLMSIARILLGCGLKKNVRPCLGIRGDTRPDNRDDQ